MAFNSKLNSDVALKFEAIIGEYPDFPKPGIIFKDMWPALQDVKMFKEIIAVFAAEVRRLNATVIIGAESRGFVLGAPLALELGLPFVPARKKGKLPGEVFTQGYELEYGVDYIQIQKSALKANDRCFIIDDLLATGGTAEAVLKLINEANAVSVGCGFLMVLDFLKGYNKLLSYNSELEISTLITID